MWHKTFAGSNFCDICDFSSNPQKYKLLQIKIIANIFPAKIYSRVNFVELKFAKQKYSTKKLCLLNYIGYEYRSVVLK